MLEIALCILSCVPLHVSATAEQLPPSLLSGSSLCFLLCSLGCPTQAPSKAQPRCLARRAEIWAPKPVRAAPPELPAREHCKGARKGKSSTAAPWAARPGLNLLPHLLTSGWLPPELPWMSKRLSHLPSFLSPLSCQSLPVWRTGVESWHHQQDLPLNSSRLQEGLQFVLPACPTKARVGVVLHTQEGAQPKALYGLSAGAQGCRMRKDPRATRVRSQEPEPGSTIPASLSWCQLQLCVPPAGAANLAWASHHQSAELCSTGQAEVRRAEQGGWGRTWGRCAPAPEQGSSHCLLCLMQKTLPSRGSSSPRWQPPGLAPWSCASELEGTGKPRAEQWAGTEQDRGVPEARLAAGT